MTIRPQIEDPQGVHDPKASTILRTMKIIIDKITGRSQAPVQKLGASADLGSVVSKVNEIIDRMQT